MTSVANAASPALERARGDGGAEQHEAELAGLRQGEAKAQRVRVSSPAMRASTKAIAALASSSAAVAPTSSAGCVARQRQIGRHADRDEEEAEQQALERLDVGLQLVAVFGLRQQHAGHEGAERRRQARDGREQGGAGDDEQRDGGEDLRRLRAADGAEQRPHQEAAADQDDGDRDRRACHVVPGDVVGQSVARQQRHQRDQRNEGEVLEQQHGERVAAGAAGEQVALGQHRQHDRGGGHRKARAEHDRARPADADRMGESRQRRAADHHLRRAEAEHRAPHHPQPLRPHLQADQEQQHHHAKAGDGGDRFDVGDQPQPRRTDDDAGEQIAEHAAEAGAPCQRHGDRGGGEQDDESGQHALAIAAGDQGSVMPRTPTTRTLRDRWSPSRREEATPAWRVAGGLASGEGRV